jgi:uncharacterized protein YcbK (DUF882 family)
MLGLGAACALVGLTPLSAAARTSKVYQARGGKPPEVPSFTKPKARPSQGVRARGASDSQKVLSFRNAHSDETLTVVYWSDGRYVPSGLKKISRLMRDQRTNQVRLIDPRLLDQLYDLKMRLSPNSHFEVFSGYRSPASNARLRRTSSRVAKNSLHMQGQAVDVKLVGVRTSTLAKTARKMERGGVGYYRRFVHLDSGDVRTWRG